MRNITIINRHYPPNPGITGEAAWDLVQYLLDNYQINPIIIHIDRNDLGGGMVRQPIGEVFTVKTIYKGENKTLKMIAGFFDGFFLIIKALYKAKGSIIVMTSPPMLPFWASFIFKIFGKKWILWAMDLFPEGFAAAKTMKSTNYLYRQLLTLNYLFSPKKIIVLGKNQGIYLKEKYKKDIEAIFLPCGVLANHQNTEKQPDWKLIDDKIYFGYCGNLGEAHSEDFLIEFIKNLNPDKHQLILAIYGTKSAKVLQFAKGRQGITILKNVPRIELHFIDVHLASLLSEWTHIAVPSKIMSTIGAGSSFVFCGNEESDSWQMNKEAGWLVDINKDIGFQIKSLMYNLDFEAIKNKKKFAKIKNELLINEMITGYAQIANSF